MAINDTLGIPSGIRRSYLPFVPKSDPGFFTFKGHSDKANIITPFSKNLGKLVAYDSGISLTHDQKKAKLELEQYLNYIPSLQIREYMPDPKLTQLFKWIDAFRAGFKSGQEAASEINAETFSLDKVWEGMQNIRNQINQKFQELTMDSAIGLRTVVAGLGPEHFQDMKFPFGSDQKFAVLYAPFLLYYRLNTTTTTNIYEIPFDINVSHNTLMHSDGTYGWGAGDAFSAGIIGLKGESLASKILGLNTLKTNMMPSFNPDGTTKGLDFSIEFTLINDTAEGAANNYIMLHNLFGNNRWLQYGFVQAPASLYDVKVPGANRYFMCKGQFSCTAVGGFRTPSNLLCNKIVESSSGKRPAETMYSFSQSKEQWNKDIEDAKRRNNRELTETKIEGALGVDLSDQPDQTEAFQQTVDELDTLDSEILEATESKDETINNLNISLGMDGGFDMMSSEDLRSMIPENHILVSDVDAVDLKIKEANGEEMTQEEKDNLYYYRLSELADTNDRLANLNDSKTLGESILQSSDADQYMRQHIAAGLMQQYDNGQNLDVDTIVEGNQTLAKMLSHNVDPFKLDAIKQQLNLTELKAGNASLSNRTKSVELKRRDEEQAENADQLSEQINDKIESINKRNEMLDNLHNTINTLEAQEQAATQLKQTSGDLDSSANIFVQREYFKIPDAYKVKLQFTSLLPDNFNNFLYGFRNDNLDPVQHYALGGKGPVDHSVFETMFEQLKNFMK